jgi:hypothetical protein
MANVETSLCEERGEFQLICLLHVILPPPFMALGQPASRIYFQACLIKVKNLLG